MQHMTVPRAVIFDLGGTLLDWPDWEEGVIRSWGQSYDQLVASAPGNHWPERDAYIQAMCEAEQAHWRRVVSEQWSGPPSSLISEGFRLLGLHASEAEILAALDGYARAVDGWAEVFPDARETLLLLRERGYRIGLLSNTWWAAEWHNADLAAHGLSGLFDEMVYTSDLPHSKPHPSVFLEVAARLAVESAACVMVGDRMIDDIGGSLGAGMRGVWKQTDYPWPKAEHIIPTAVVTHLAEVPGLLREWGGK
ncbi:MAG TPA: HAD family hydrolase [Ktedonobacteraceae bacterium]|nr:HAD family hydrolase [Ktedonobacteraceae bacterium]